MKKLCLALLILSGVANAQKLSTPAEFLGYELGDRFTAHQRTVDYFNYVANLLPNVEVRQYGETYEHRPLIYAIVTSPENFQNLESIRQDNLKRTGLVEGAASADKKAIIWLSYNVHGNEASGMEAALMTLYELSNPENKKAQEWLKNAVVILDPCINPDGRDRYANFYRQYGNQTPNGNNDAFENREPWPGGRANHYLFDLNRDWAWGTQQETRQRIKVYNEWMPHVHVDFHEQGYNNPYFFAPAAEPLHEVISPWQRQFQLMIGKNNAKYFDAKGWLYFTKEVFDLYYPSYGDTYPTYSGAIGMTYEQGGQRGITITTREGDPLTLKDRLLHHHTTGMSTVEVTAQNYTRVVDEFEKYFRENLSSAPAPYKTYVIKGSNAPDKIERFAKWLDSHSIKFGYPAAAKATRGFDYQTQTTTTVNVSTDDIIFNIYQPKSRFITTVFEPQSKLPDSLTYDITAWNLFYASNVKAYALTERLNVAKSYSPPALAAESAGAEKPYAYIFDYHGVQDVAFLAALMQKGIKVRASEKSFSLNSHTFSPGTLIIPQRNNEKVADFDNTVRSLAQKMGRKVFTTQTGFVDSGKDFGSGYVHYLRPPQVAVLAGPQTYSLSFGEVWYFFEQELHYPITAISTDYFKQVDLSKYNVLIIPDGNYRILDEGVLEKLSEWTNKGGKLIILANALTSFAEKKGFALKTYATDAEKSEAEKKEKEAAQKGMLIRYEEAERRDVSNFISGAIYKIRLDNSHPLAFGLTDTYYTLKANELRYAFMENEWNVGVIKGKAKPVQGFAGKVVNEKLENSLVFGVEQKGDGAVVYMVDNPLFRCFWEDGKMLFANAVFMVGD